MLRYETRCKNKCSSGRITLVSFLIPLLLSSCGTINQRPLTTYSGTIRSDDTTSSFVVVGDVQFRGFSEIFLLRENNRAAVEAMFRKIGAESPSFVLLLGDLTFPGSSKKAWEDFDELVKPVYDRGIPIYPLPGNHEYPCDYTAAFEEYFGRFPNTRHAFWYSIQWKDVGIITLNSNFEELDSKQVIEQGKWYLNEMERMQNEPSIAVVIVSCHHPPFTNSTTVHDDKVVQASFVPAYLKTMKAKLYLSGHCHSYEHFKIGGKDFIVSGGGGPYQTLATPALNSIKEDLFTNGCKRDHHFCRVKRLKDDLFIEMVRIDDDTKQWSVGDAVHVPVK